jgi:Protein-tyrosine phosphatase
VIYGEVVVEIRSVVACTDCGLYWDEDSELAKCRNDDHEHRVFEVHRHLSTVVLPGGATLRAASFDPSNPYTRDADPDYGLYLDSRWRPPWDHSHIDWPDYGVPEKSDAVVEALRAVLERARSGQRIEVGCLGGHGRTGTALACLAVLSGHPAEDAVTWVRSNYCTHAVETPEQEAFVAALGDI